jgi:hypothetical protein
MKRHVFVFGLCLWMGMAGWVPVKAQSFDVQQLLLDIQKLSQLKQILTDLKQGYQILDAGYSAVRDIAKGNFNLHQAFLDGLLAVSPAVKNYQRVADIVDLEASMLGKYQAAWAQFQRSGRLTPGELSLLGQVYGNLFNEAAKGLTDLVNILTDGTLRASDAERMAAIDGIYAGMVEKATFLDRVNNTTALLAIQRAGEEKDVEVLKGLYGLGN